MGIAVCVCGGGGGRFPNMLPSACLSWLLLSSVEHQVRCAWHVVSLVQLLRTSVSSHSSKFSTLKEFGARIVRLELGGAQSLRN